MNPHRLISVAWLFFSMANGITFPILPIYIHELSGSYIAVGLITALPAFMFMAMSFGWGALSDKIGERKKIIIISNLVGAVVYFSFDFLTADLLLLMRTVQSVFLASAYLIPALITEYFPEERGKALGDFQSFGALGWVIGGLSAGYLYTSGYIFIVCGCVGLVFTLLMVPLKEIRKKTLKKFYFFKFGNIKVLLYLSLAIIVLMTSAGIISGLFSVYMKGFGVSEVNIGRVSALTGLSVALTISLAGRICDRVGSERVFALTCFSYIWIWIALALTENMLLFGMIYAIPAYSFFFVSTTSIAAEATSVEERGRGIGLVNSSMWLGNFLGPLLGGFLAQGFDISSAFKFAGGVCVISTAIAVYLWSIYER